MQDLLIKRGVAFLWQERVAVFGLAAVLVLAQLIYFAPVFLSWWVALFLGWLLLFSFWWQKGLKGAFLPQLLGSLLLSLAFLGVAIFIVRSVWAFELILLFYLWAFWYLLKAFQNLRRDGHFEVKDLARLYWGELAALFFVLVGVFSAASFFGWGLSAVALWVAFLAGLAFYLWASRAGLEKMPLWFYLALLVVILEEVLFVLFPWQRGIFFKAFLLFIFYYLYLEFLRHFLAGNLTLRVVGEQLIIVGALVGFLLILDLAAAVI